MLLPSLFLLAVLSCPHHCQKSRPCFLRFSAVISLLLFSVLTLFPRYVLFVASLVVVPNQGCLPIPAGCAYSHLSRWGKKNPRKHCLSSCVLHCVNLSQHEGKAGLCSPYCLGPFSPQQKWSSQQEVTVKTSDEEAWRGNSFSFCFLLFDTELHLNVRHLEKLKSPDSGVSTLSRKMWIGWTSRHAVKPNVHYEMSNKCSRWAVHSSTLYQQHSCTGRLAFLFVSRLDK